MPSIPHGCAENTQEALAFDASLRPSLGYAFRWNEPVQGYIHLWAIHDDGGVIDLSTARRGQPDGYLGVRLERHEAALLSGGNSMMGARA